MTSGLLFRIPVAELKATTLRRRERLLLHRTSEFAAFWRARTIKMPRAKSQKRGIASEGQTDSNSKKAKLLPSAAVNNSEEPQSLSTNSETCEEKEKNPVLLLAHGAGAPSTSEWMQRWKNLLAPATDAIEVITFDYPYLAGGKKGTPPKAEKLVDFHTEKAKEATAKYPGHPLILVGKSMGARISCMVAARDDIHVSAVICLGYPLKGMNGKLRDETLIQLKVPILLVQGSKDGMCPLKSLEAVRKKMQAENDLHVVDGGDHSLMIGKKYLKENGTNQNDEEKKASIVVESFIKKLLGRSE